MNEVDLDLARRVARGEVPHRVYMELYKEEDEKNARTDATMTNAWRPGGVRVS